jgi:cellulose synthase/poly-beta-1,6-N-acetylglucosamine synthase-like glycosyltransferase
MKDLVVSTLRAFDYFVLAYFLLLNSTYLLLILAAWRETARMLRRPDAASHDDIFANPMTPAISIVIGAYNEEACIVESVRATLGLRYPQFEVVVVDDGSTDDTFERLRTEFNLVEVAPDIPADIPTIGAIRSMHVPSGGLALVVVRKVNVGRRADALNAGLNVAQHPLVCCVDADSILEHDGLLRVAKPFVDDPERVVAVGGVIRPINGSTVYRGQLTATRQPRSWLARIQIVEYLRSFLLGRTAWSQFGALVIISGAFGLYRRDRLIEIGGFDPTSLGEDADAVVALHQLMCDQHRPYRIVYLPQPVCWTEVPTTTAVLGRQRTRWSHGLAQVLWKYRRMMFNARYGRVGLVALPYYLVFELIGPVIELVGLVAVIAGFGFGVVDAQFALLFGLVAILYGIALSVAAMFVEELSFHRYSRWRDLGVGAAASVLENLGYRQLHSWWRLKGLVHAARGHEPSWGEMTRTGFDTEVAGREPRTAYADGTSGQRSAMRPSVAGIATDETSSAGSSAHEGSSSANSLATSSTRPPSSSPRSPT